MFRMKMTTIYPSTATTRPTTTTTATAIAIARPTIAPAYATTIAPAYATTITPAYAAPILAIPQNQVLFGSIFQKINSNGPCSSCGNSK